MALYMHPVQALTGAGLGPVHFVPVLEYGFLNAMELCADLLNTDKFSGNSIDEYLLVNMAAVSHSCL